MKKDMSEQSSSRTWLLLNSPIFLWFLSAVVVALVVEIYTQRSINIEERMQRRNSIVKLERELQSRISQYMVWLEEATEPLSKEETYPIISLLSDHNMPLPRDFDIHDYGSGSQFYEFKDDTTTDRGYRKHKAPHLKKPAVLMAFSAVNGERFV